MINETPSPRRDAVVPKAGQETVGAERLDARAEHDGDAPPPPLVLLEGVDDDAVCTDEFCLPGDVEG